MYKHHWMFRALPPPMPCVSNLQSEHIGCMFWRIYSPQHLPNQFLNDRILMDAVSPQSRELWCPDMEHLAQCAMDLCSYRQPRSMRNYWIEHYKWRLLLSCFGGRCQLRKYIRVARNLCNNIVMACFFPREFHQLLRANWFFQMRWNHGRRHPSW